MHKLTIWAITILLLLSACTALAPTTQPSLLSTGEPVSPQSADETTLRILADNSSTEVITELSHNFEAVTPDVRVEPYFGSSHQLTDQLGAGNPADIFITASHAQMEAAAESGLLSIDEAQALFGTKLVIIYAQYNPGQVGSLKDLAKPGLILALPDTTTPAGNYTLEVLDKASKLPEYGDSFKDNVLENAQFYEPDTRAVVERVQRGEAQAGIAYLSDLSPKTALSVSARNIPDELNTNIIFWIAPLNNALQAASAQAFIAYVLSAGNQDLLTNYHLEPVR